jgi:hypothetical protein
VNDNNKKIMEGVLFLLEYYLLLIQYPFVCNQTYATCLPGIDREDAYNPDNDIIMLMYSNDDFRISMGSE